MQHEKFGRDRHFPDGDWSRATSFSEVAGVNHRRDDVRQFAEAVKTAETQKRYYGVRLEPEPTNPHDKNAIRVIGRCEVSKMFGGPSIKEWLIGYVDKQTAADLNAAYVSKGFPLAGEMYGIYQNDEGFIEVQYFALAPSDAVKTAAKSARDATVNSAVSETLTDEQAEYIREGALGLYRITRNEQAKALKSSGRYEDAVRFLLRVSVLDAMGVRNSPGGAGYVPTKQTVFSNDDFQAPGIISEIILGANAIGATEYMLKSMLSEADQAERECLRQYEPKAVAAKVWKKIGPELIEGMKGGSKWRKPKTG